MHDDLWLSPTRAAMPRDGAAPGSRRLAPSYSPGQRSGRLVPSRDAGAWRLPTCARCSGSEEPAPRVRVPVSPLLGGDRPRTFSSGHPCGRPSDEHGPPGPEPPSGNSFVRDLGNPLPLRASCHRNHPFGEVSLRSPLHKSGAPSFRPPFRLAFPSALRRLRPLVRTSSPAGVRSSSEPGAIPELLNRNRAISPDHPQPRPHRGPGKLSRMHANG